MIPLLTMIIVRENSEVVIIYPDLSQKHGAPFNGGQLFHFAFEVAFLQVFKPGIALVAYPAPVQGFESQSSERFHMI